MIGVPATGSSQQISVLGGPIFNDKGDISVSVMAEYSQHIQDLFSFSVGFLNEGHFDSPSKHHRDGLVGQAWIGGTDISKKVSIRLGFGPYLYFDSTTNGRNLHSVGAITSLDFQYALTDKWFLDLRGSYILASRMNTMPLFAGLGYKFDSSNVSVNKEPTRNELDLFLGFSVVNSPGSNTSFAGAIEYRKNVWNHIDITVAYLNEGNNKSVKRQGGTSQIWFMQKLSDCFEVGIGGGIYEAYDSYRNTSLTTNGIVSLTGSYRIYNNWATRITWDRVLTSYNRDSDVVLVGLGYEF